uniref:G5 domain-containing protein n=1 Tax=uncultured Chloroflexota bacterium TaxID=166587 RepID=H5S9A1_9CHLR|nr:hypothetical protein HGMM_F03B08C15 [uncultured Chloroflexota bacterium]
MALLSLWFFLSACELAAPTRTVDVKLEVDGVVRSLQAPVGSTVRDVLQLAGVTPQPLDRSEPPFYQVVGAGEVIRLKRVREEFKTEQVSLPFEQQVVRSESLPSGETRLIQEGKNGQQEITYRILYEDGVEVSRSVVKSVTLVEAQPQILLVGAQSSFPPVAIPGTLVYLSAGNAWVMQGSTGVRRPLVTTGDLDGRIFVLSPNGSYLLFSRKSTRPASEEINTLWVVSTDPQKATPFPLRASNVVHFADWLNNTTVLYSTVEPRQAAPGWQANNDLYRVTIYTNRAGASKRVLDASSGGVYGWWGSSYAVSPLGQVAYARPGEIGLVDIDKGRLTPLLEILPYQTYSDWAWTPPIGWGADGKTLFVVYHVPFGAPVPDEASPLFDLRALGLTNGANVNLVESSGMFANPVASPLRTQGREKGYQLAYLQAIFPLQSQESRYRLYVMDRDGSDRRLLFPPLDQPGLEPQVVVWSPQPLPGQSGYAIAVIYAGNLWLVESETGKAYQVTGDGLITRIDWR